MGATAGLNIVGRRKLRACDSTECETWSGRRLNMLSEKRKKDEKEIFSEHLTAGQTSGVLFSLPKQDDLSVLTAGVNGLSPVFYNSPERMKSLLRQEGRVSNPLVGPADAILTERMARLHPPIGHLKSQASTIPELDACNSGGSMVPAARPPASGSLTGFRSSPLLVRGNGETVSQFNQIFLGSTAPVHLFNKSFLSKELNLGASLLWPTATILNVKMSRASTKTNKPLV